MVAGSWPLRCCEMFDYDCDRTYKPTDAKAGKTRMTRSLVNKLLDTWSI
jgi:hypothetical protein